MRHLCAATIPGNVKYFKYDWKKESWNLFLVLGLVIGGFIAATFMSNPDDIAISEATKADLMKLGLTDFSSYIPREVFAWNHLMTLPGFLLIIVGGFLVGFGARYANGCTSGHCIMGTSLLNAGSLGVHRMFLHRWACDDLVDLSADFLEQKNEKLIVSFFRNLFRNRFGEKRGRFVVSYSGDVPFSIDSHVWNHGNCSSNRGTFGFLNQKAENKIGQ